jgi:hypothetical protein
MTVDTENPSSSLLDEASATMVAFEGDAVQVPAAVIAYGFELETPMVQSLMRSGELTSLCEKGGNEDIGRYRLTFFLYESALPVGHRLDRQDPQAISDRFR